MEDRDSKSTIQRETESIRGRKREDLAGFAGDDN